MARAKHALKTALNLADVGRHQVRILTPAGAPEITQLNNTVTAP